MKKFLMVVLSCLLFATVCQAQSAPFKLLSVSANEVKIKTLSETTLYDIALVADSQTYKGKSFSNTKGDVKLPGGATAIAGSSLLLPSQYGAMQLSPGTEATISGFNAPKDFKAKSVMFLTKKDAKPLYLDIP